MRRNLVDKNLRNLWLWKSCKNFRWPWFSVSPFYCLCELLCHTHCNVSAKQGGKTQQVSEHPRVLSVWVDCQIFISVKREAKLQPPTEEGQVTPWVIKAANKVTSHFISWQIGDPYLIPIAKLIGHQISLSISSSHPGSLRKWTKQELWSCVVHQYRTFHGIWLSTKHHVHC